MTIKELKLASAHHTRMAALKRQRNSTKKGLEGAKTSVVCVVWGGEGGQTAQLICEKGEKKLKVKTFPVGWKKVGNLGEGGGGKAKESPSIQEAGTTSKRDLTS